ncbi:hypothetical protein DAPPUDRAFT_106066 [Daphnia pulex]|uniref:Helicase ATP-binding domain-containing protein n=1 Tax=Daphnia pulex TaxID=6669 RepID=E9GSN3_DAPPU|nr:hypothetical protein DAPPUDRAFT_106066 [Daphnia pulex]|eukprot:EFX77459.1 hypothetical protein DAPPUDRAFT_106066 [Daphnia pulex]
MWNACFTTNFNAGCILAHCMGLGKSLQVVTLSHTVLMNAVCKVERVLIVCPVSTIHNWTNEFKIWLPDNSFVTLNVCELSSSEDIKARDVKITRWLKLGGILITGYDKFRLLTKKKDNLSEQDEVYLRALVKPGPDLIVCDEGQLLQNEDSAIYKAMDQICTRRRIMLSGTPLQNNLIEYLTMVDFINPGQLGTKTLFIRNFVNVLEKGQMVDATELEVRAMKRRSVILHKILESTVKRFDRYCSAFRQQYTKGGATQPTECKVESAGLLSDYRELSRMCNHPKALSSTALKRCNAKKRPDSKTGEKSKKEDTLESEDSASSCHWWSSLISDDVHNIEHGGKMILLLDILRRCEVIGDKLLVFSQSLTSLNLIEEFLAKEELKNQSRSAGNASAVSDAFLQPKILVANHDLYLKFSGTWNINEDFSFGWINEIRTTSDMVQCI